MFHPEYSGLCVVLCVTSLGKPAFAKALADKPAFAKALADKAGRLKQSYDHFTPLHLVVR
jgi:hypothetical protein